MQHGEKDEVLQAAPQLCCKRDLGSGLSLVEMHRCRLEEAVTGCSRLTDQMHFSNASKPLDLTGTAGHQHLCFPDAHFWKIEAVKWGQGPSLCRQITSVII